MLHQTGSIQVPPIFSRLILFMIPILLIAAAASCTTTAKEEPEPVRIASLTFQKGDRIMDYPSVNFPSSDIPHTGLPAGATMEDVEHFLRRAAIDIPAGERRQFVFGDNISGYLELFTHSYRRGNGYQIAESTVIADVAAAWNGTLLNRRIDADKAVLYPGFIRHEYEQAHETLSLFANSHSMALNLTSPKGEAAIISFFPAFKTSLSRYDVEVVDDVFLLVPHRLSSDHPSVIAISSDVAVTAGENFRASLGREPEETAVYIQGSDPANSSGSIPVRLQQLGSEQIGQSDRDVRNALKVSDHSPLLSFSTVEKVESAGLYISFGMDRSSALEAARHARSRGIEDHFTEVLDITLSSNIRSSNSLLDASLYWSLYSGYSMVTRQYGTGIWAGLPWFRQNWGRDTFIALPGILLVNGRFEDAKAVLHNFTRFQNLDEEDVNYGRVPNRVNNPDDIIYNTTDGTPWLLREALEYIQYSGDTDFAPEILETARHYIRGARANYLGEDGLLHHDDADTWMDARIAGNQPWSARGSKAVEIQALWYTALKSSAEIARLSGELELANEWGAMAARAQQSFIDQFWDGDSLADRIRPDGTADTKLRPNQLMAISVPFLGEMNDQSFLSPAQEAAVVQNAVNGLLYPYGIASLDPAHPYFHPHHDQTGKFHKDAAYHNGTVWGWNAGPALTALLKIGDGEISSRLILNLADQIITMGTAGSMSELLDALPDEDGHPIPSGTFSQAWSVSEYSRVLLQDLLGFRPRLLENTLHLAPRIGEDILPPGEELSARLAFGREEYLNLRVRREGNGETVYTIQNGSDRDYTLEMSIYSGERGWLGKSQIIAGGSQISIRENDTANWNVVYPAFPSVLESLQFRDPEEDRKQEFPAMKEQNYLQKIIQAGEFR